MALAIEHRNATGELEDLTAGATAPADAEVSPEQRSIQMIRGVKSAGGTKTKSIAPPKPLATEKKMAMFDPSARKYAMESAGIIPDAKKGVTKSLLATNIPVPGKKSVGVDSLLRSRTVKGRGINDAKSGYYKIERDPVSGARRRVFVQTGTATSNGNFGTPVAPGAATPIPVQENKNVGGNNLRYTHYADGSGGGYSTVTFSGGISGQEVPRGRRAEVTVGDATFVSSIRNGRELEVGQYYPVTPGARFSKGGGPNNPNEATLIKKDGQTYIVFHARGSDAPPLDIAKVKNTDGTAFTAGTSTVVTSPAERDGTLIGASLGAEAATDSRKVFTAAERSITERRKTAPDEDLAGLRAEELAVDAARTRVQSASTELAKARKTYEEAKTKDERTAAQVLVNAATRDLFAAKRDFEVGEARKVLTREQDRLKTTRAALDEEKEKLGKAQVDGTLTAAQIYTLGTELEKKEKALAADTAKVTKLKGAIDTAAEPGKPEDFDPAKAKKNLDDMKTAGDDLDPSKKTDEKAAGAAPPGPDAPEKKKG